MQPRSLDEARRLRPDLGFSVYAIEPRGAVTLEVLDAEKSFTFTGATEAEVWAVAFPVDEPPFVPEPSDLSADKTSSTSVFD